MKLHIILLLLSFQCSLVAQDKTGGFPYFLWSETYQNSDNFKQLDIETILYSYSETDSMFLVEDYSPSFAESYDEHTFYVKIIQKSKASKEKTTQEYFRLDDKNWRKVKTDTSGIVFSEIEVLEDVVLVDSVEYCHALEFNGSVAFDSGLWLMKYKKIKETNKIKAKKEEE